VQRRVATSDRSRRQTEGASVGGRGRCFRRLTSPTQNSWANHFNQAFHQSLPTKEDGPPSSRTLFLLCRLKEGAIWEIFPFQHPSTQRLRSRHPCFPSIAWLKSGKSRKPIPPSPLDLCKLRPSLAMDFMIIN
jgi:hypothetical protein